MILSASEGPTVGSAQFVGKYDFTARRPRFNETPNGVTNRLGRSVVSTAQGGEPFIATARLASARTVRKRSAMESGE